MYEIILKLSNYFLVIEILITSIKLSSFSVDENGVLLSAPHDPTMTITLEGEILKGKRSLEDVSLLNFEKGFLINTSKKNSFRQQEWALFDVEVLVMKIDGNKITLKIRYSDKVKLL
ncbi:MAG: hypothetical protein DDT42_01770 [candidate division WS2 bacterium]|uniref:Uncharacterized protein n=1 Tax=Psychracetigena formicireducens TaxID=2986056 RepID=A0A9E2BHZ4_PSYF1|nr:hypothetical protein [Candidatus Psychracetigena formicireducens]